MLQPSAACDPAGSYWGLWTGYGVWLLRGNGTSSVSLEEPEVESKIGEFYGKGVLSRSSPCFFTTKPHQHHKSTNDATNVNLNAVKRQQDGFHRSTKPGCRGWWPPVERKDSHNLYHMFQNGVHEPLQLGLEEAFFLVFDLQTLIVFMCEDTNNLKEQSPVLLSYHALINALDLQTQILAMKRPLTKEECFALFSFAKPTFMASYLVYSHFKKQGWTIKTGLKYGADFVLYHDSPFLSHAEWAVKIINQKKEALSCILNENVLNNIQRIIKHVAKGLILCFIDNTNTTFSCLNQQNLIKTCILKK